MYTKKKPEDLDCGIEVAMKIFGGKWKPCIIDSINKGKKRPSEIHRAIPSATPRVINIQLRELENYKIVSKTIYPGLPPKVEYNLTAMGRSILPIIAALDEWGQRNSKEIKKLSEVMKVVGAINMK
jgi:DNA-binding HxlR family transcriptional regulator